MCQIISHKAKCNYDKKNDQGPFEARLIDWPKLFLPKQQNNYHDQQYNIFKEGLPIGDDKCITETSAI